MLEKPHLSDEKIISCLCNSYRLPVASIDFLPAGNDASAWVYKVKADSGKSYFLKVKKGTVYEPSLAVPRYLKDQGIEQVVAPFPTDTQALWKQLDDFALILYPFITGPTGMEVGLSERQWLELGTVLKNIHSTKLSAELSGRVKKETFAPKWSYLVKQLQVQIKERHFADPFEKELGSFWQEKSQEIGQIVGRTEELGRMLRHQGLDFVLCHADIHTANVLLDQEDRLFIVDWDETIFAPKERDLMHVVEDAAGDFGMGTPEALFFRGYGKPVIDPVALAYYRYEWVVQEIGDYGERVFLMKDVGEETKKDAVQGFLALFQLGDVVEAAYKSEDSFNGLALHSKL